jgi:hypothetical protein
MTFAEFASAVRTAIGEVPGASCDGLVWTKGKQQACLSKLDAGRASIRLEGVLANMPLGTESWGYMESCRLQAEDVALAATVIRDHLNRSAGVRHPRE